MSNERNSDAEESNSITDGRLSRRNVVKSIGVAGGVGVGGALGTSPAAAAEGFSSASAEGIDGHELQRVVRTAANRADVKNVMGSTLRGTVLNGQLVELDGDKPRAVVTRRSRASRSSVLESADRGDVVVSAVRHTLPGGNEVTVVAFVATTDRAVVYYDFDEAYEGASTKARSYDIEGDGTVENSRLVADESSANGRQSTSTAGFSITSSCEGCEIGPGATGSREVEECTDLDLFCAGSCCSACSGASYCGPYALVCGAACIMTWCVGCVGYCCNEYGTTCQAC